MTEKIKTQIGHNAKATEWLSTAIGDESMATGLGSVALGNNAYAPADWSVAIGANSVADEDWTVSFGDGNEGPPITRRLVNVKEGDAPSDAVTVSQLTALAARVEALEGQAMSHQIVEQLSAILTRTANALKGPSLAN